jgi:hypothetical protein
MKPPWWLPLEQIAGANSFGKLVSPSKERASRHIYCQCNKGKFSLQSKEYAFLLLIS